MLTGPDALTIEKVHPGVVSILEIVLCRGTVKSKIACHYLLLKQNTYPREAVALNYFGCDKCLLTRESHKVS